MHQVSKLVCINSPPPGAAIAGPRASTGAVCGGPRLAAAPAAGPGLQEHRHPSFVALAPEIGGVCGDWKRYYKGI